MMTHGDYRVRTTRESDHLRVRAFRIENATEHPISYGASLETTLSMSEDDWRTRARRGEQTDATSVVAIERSTGRWVGMMGAQDQDADGTDPVLNGVYVLPDYRGRTTGIADLLLADILDWASRRQAARLRLYVYEASSPARRFYERHGFTPTGRFRPHSFAPGSVLELARPMVSPTNQPTARGPERTQ